MKGQWLGQRSGQRDNDEMSRLGQRSGQMDNDERSMVRSKVRSEGQ